MKHGIDLDHLSDFRLEKTGDLAVITNQVIEITGNIKTGMLTNFTTNIIGPFSFGYKGIRYNFPAITRINYHKKYAECHFIEFGIGEPVRIYYQDPRKVVGRYHMYDQDIYIKVNWFTQYFLNTIGDRYKTAHQLACIVWGEHQMTGLLSADTTSTSTSTSPTEPLL